MKEILQGWAAESGFTVLYACESGSRAWDMASPDSDYDVRFLYVRPPAWYLSVRKRPDTLIRMEGEQLDFAGWDLRKALGLLGKSNANLFEWLRSPVVYADQPGFKAALQRLSRHFFSTRAVAHHYLGIATGAQAEAEAGQRSLKKYLYILRPLLAADYTLRHLAPPPIELPVLLAEWPGPDEIKTKIESLRQQKLAQAEKAAIAADPDLEAYIAEALPRLRAQASGHPAHRGNLDELDAFFQEWLYRFAP
ncbi:MAG: nucleotidyltransferase domain-containing protein [Bacteroidetes bacterium]|nr:MAG: nucleotidyltransferase domain-containing protein [Bacteroidota bacterium]